MEVDKLKAKAHFYDYCDKLNIILEPLSYILCSVQFDVNSLQL